MTAIDREYEAYNELLPKLLREHRGEFVLFKNLSPVAFFASFAEAYESGLQRFGVDGDFLIDEVLERSAQPASLSWETGAMFSE